MPDTYSQPVVARVSDARYTLGMIQITPAISIDESEIQETFVRASGPGGQNVNKVSTAVQLRFDVAHSVSLPDDVKRRPVSLAGNRMTVDGILTIDSRRFRAQLRNRQEAVTRLVELIRDAVQPPAIRYKTRPTLGSKERRLESKKRGGEIKQGRGRVSNSNE